METLKILTVDDEPGIRTGVRRALRNFTVSFPFHEDDFDYEIIDAESGEEALEILSNNKIDIVLLDNVMPGIEGIEVLENIKQNEVDTAVMMITSHASIELAVKATNNGAFNFIPKPFTQQELKSAIENITKHLLIKRITKNMKDEARQIRFQFLSVLSHELKSPINAIEGYLQIMKDEQVGKNISDYQNIIDRSLERIKGMRGLIMDMLDLTKIESGKKVREIKMTDVSAIASLAVDSVYPIAVQRNVKIHRNFPSGLIMNTDSSEIEIIFNNLLTNAVKYNKENGEVFFSLSMSEKELIITVEDTGIGMSSEDTARLFNDFVRIKNKKTLNISGSGLGLSIMKKIVDLNKGIVNVKSEVDKGTKFTVILSQT